MNDKKYPNLKPWQPGQSGNPAGRKPGSKNMSTIVQELLDQDANNGILTSNNLDHLTNGATTTYAKAVVFAAIAKALQGNMQAIIWLAEQQERESSVQARERQEPIVITNIKPRHFAVD
jgi:fructose-1,6-bisphosphatase/sedoheptulose 1,7-bisphosphatase-like protein